MKFSDFSLQPRGLDPAQAAAYVGGQQLIEDWKALGWLKPFVQRHRLTRYDRLELDKCIERQKNLDETHAAA